MDKKVKRIAFLVSGWGLGHATRIWAIIQQVKAEDKSCVVTVLTWGKALYFFERHSERLNIEIVRLKPYAVGQDTLYTWNWADYFLKPIKWFQIWLINSLFLFRYFKKNSQDIYVFDSDFHYFSVLFFKTKRVSISQTPYVIEHWAKLKAHFPIRLKINFVFFEYLDFVIQKTFNHLIICPRLDKSERQCPKIIFVPPIVRSEFLPKRKLPYTKNETKLAAIGSGSVLVSLMDETIRQYKIPYAYNSNSPFGLDENNQPIIDQYNTLFTQCGLSTLSEGAARGNKLLLFPISQSPEQIINSVVCESLNLGYRVDADMSPISISTDKRLVVEAWDEYDGAKRATQLLQNILTSSYPS